MDAFGPRPALDTMADRLAAAGYVVLLPDLFYRFGEYGPYDTHTAFDGQKTRDEIMGMVHGTTQAMTERDEAAFLDGVIREGADGRIGMVGYCMGQQRKVGRQITVRAGLGVVVTGLLNLVEKARPGGLSRVTRKPDGPTSQGRCRSSTSSNPSHC